MSRLVRDEKECGMRTILSMRPTGWFQVGWSSTIPPVGALPLHYFGQDLVAWRDRSGVPHVLDAYCQHLAANLAYGGSLTHAGIQCPFPPRGWKSAGPNVTLPLPSPCHPGPPIP